MYPSAMFLNLTSEASKFVFPSLRYLIVSRQKKEDARFFYVSITFPSNVLLGLNYG